jgi:hypothetical protein
MSKKPAREKNVKDKAAKKAPAGADPAAAAEGGAAAQPKRSKLKLALFALLPLLLLGGGAYAGWAFFLATGPAGAAAHGEGGEGHGTGAKVSALLPDPRPQVSASHSYAVAVIIADVCGVLPVPALKAASEAEAAADGAMVNASWIAAVARTRTLDAKNCSYLWTELEGAEWKAAQGPAPAKAAGHH